MSFHVANAHKTAYADDINSFCPLARRNPNPDTLERQHKECKSPLNFFLRGFFFFSLSWKDYLWRRALNAVIFCSKPKRSFWQLLSGAKHRENGPVSTGLPFLCVNVAPQGGCCQLREGSPSLPFLKQFLLKALTDFKARSSLFSFLFLISFSYFLSLSYAFQTNLPYISSIYISTENPTDICHWTTRGVWIGNWHVLLQNVRTQFTFPYNSAHI